MMNYIRPIHLPEPACPAFCRQVRFARVVIDLKNPMTPLVSTKFIIIFALDIWNP